MTENETATETAGTSTETETTTTGATQIPAASTDAAAPGTAPAETTDTATETDADQDGKNPNKEAAKYRRQLRESEARVETQQADIRELQAEVIRLTLTGTLANTADFDQFIGLEKVLGDDGRIDRAKLDAEVAATLEERPYLKPQRTQVFQRPKPARGTEVTGGKTDAGPQSTAAKYFGATGDGKSKWGQILGERGQATTELGNSARARSNKVKFQIGTEES